MGTVQGSYASSAWTNRTIFQFQGIPYAKSPTAQLRFQPPIKTTSWLGTLDATKPGIHCPQITEEYVNIDNEDCLSLSVFSNNISATQPVMVFIHGGWFIFGGASEYSPEYLLEMNIVLVVIQYRLGPLGFLSTLSDQIPGNVGILDIIAALEWVQQNIEAFGGNSSSVTIFGESAGSAAVSALLHTPLMRSRPLPLFHRAILQSGSIFSPWAMCDTPVIGAYDIAKRLGCAEEYYERCLQTASIENLLKAFDSHRRDMIIQHGYQNVAGASVVVGGPSGLFPEHPSHYLSQASDRISLMGGVTSQDGLFLLDEICALQAIKPESLNSFYDLLEFVRLLHGKFGHNQPNGAPEGYELLEHFSTSELNQIRWEDIVLGLTDICGNHGIKGPTLVDIQAFYRVNPDGVYLYTFDYSNLLTHMNSTIYFPYEAAVHHAADLYYLFPWNTLNNEGDIKMVKIMTQLWTSFASSGVPQAELVPYWSPVHKLFGPYFMINEKSEQKENFLDEFTATTRRFRNTGQANKHSKAFLIIAFLVISAI
ncbi:glutactin-like [Topomyia yanbarensis]|uniref:glutactin-like n=1 Tax=Topomyia yanbarensis TaxID=2498891 RepID=UPI00273CE596|nr:glutactin-like [Topomyia yanbarensis]